MRLDSQSWLKTTRPARDAACLALHWPINSQLKAGKKNSAIEKLFPLACQGYHTFINLFQHSQLNGSHKTHKRGPESKAFPFQKRPTLIKHQLTVTYVSSRMSSRIFCVCRRPQRCCYTHTHTGTIWRLDGSKKTLWLAHPLNAMSSSCRRCRSPVPGPTRSRWRGCRWRRPPGPPAAAHLHHRHK